jgi:hypothetical protein
MTTLRQRSRRSARTASGRASRRCRGSRSSSPPTINRASDGVVHYPGRPTTPTRARRLVDASVDPTEARNFPVSVTANGGNGATANSPRTVATTLANAGPAEDTAARLPG